MSALVIVIRNHVVMIVMDDDFVAVAIVCVVMMIVVHHVASPIVIHLVYLIRVVITVVGQRLTTENEQRACGYNRKDCFIHTLLLTKQFAVYSAESEAFLNDSAA